MFYFFFWWSPIPRVMTLKPRRELYYIQICSILVVTYPLGQGTKANTLVLLSTVFSPVVIMQIEAGHTRQFSRRDHVLY